MPPSSAHQVTLADILEGMPQEYRVDNAFLLECFLDWASRRGYSLYPAQETAILELFEGRNVVLNTPTGSGKSLVASALHFQSLAQGRRSVYTCPIKALVNEKWLALCKEFGAANVGLSTGDATVNRDAPILCCTAEILSNIALSEGESTTVADVVMDEFHYYSDRERGVAWQVPLLTLKKTRFMLMSATLGETAFFEEVMTGLNGLPSVTVKSGDRPVPLHFDYSEDGLPEAVQRMVREGKAPVYVVHFTQADAAGNAQNFTSLELCTKEEKQAIAAALEGFRFSSPYGPDMKRWLRQGIGLHHAGLLPKYRILVEKLAQQGLLKVICGTDTLGVGVNVPIRTVLFTQLCKYSGDKTAILTARDFHQIAGRAGRKGFDNVGYVVAQAPEHVIENLKLAAKSAKTGKKFQKRQPPEKGYVPFDKGTFERLIAASPERLVSRFQVSHGMLLNVLSRQGDGCRAMRDIIDRCHDTNKEKQNHRNRAFQLFRTLVERGIISVIPMAERKGGPGHKLRVNVDLQQNFSMDQELSLYLLDTLPLLEKENPDYHLDVLTLVESILENPELILRKQLDKLKTQRMAELKAQGVEYDQRIAELEEMEYPKPQREFIYQTFNDFTAKHPWLSKENIRPKSIAREMLEGYHTFSSYVKEYGLERSEGLLLRHLNSVYKVLSHSVPDSAKNESLREMETFFIDMLRRVDSSLLDEWERLNDPNYKPAEVTEALPPGAAAAAEAAARDITADPKSFLASIRTRIFAFMAAISRGAYEAALAALHEGWTEAPGYEENPVMRFPRDAEGQPWSDERLRAWHLSYTAGHGPFRMDVEGRALRHTLVEKTDTENGHSSNANSSTERIWQITQMLQDLQEHNDGRLIFSVDLAASRQAGAPLLQLLAVEV